MVEVPSPSPSALDVREVAGARNDSNTRTRASVWVGTRGATTPAHFDEMHNFFVQVREEEECVCVCVCV